MVQDAPFFFAVCTGMNQHVSEDINFVPKIAKGKPISKEQSDAWNHESLTAVRGMNKKNHIGQMWWIKYVVEISGIEPVK